MSGSVATKNKGVIGDRLRLEEFDGLAAELQRWRTSDDLKIIEAAKGSALVLPFVKGLRLSARLVYILRVCLSRTDLEVDWGHLLNERKDSCSPECDVIIHHKGFYREWNGNKQPVMDFKFVESRDAVAVVSCKSYAKDVDADYARKLQPYVRHVFLFAECCAPRQVASLRRKAKGAGYVGFWHLYTYDEATGDWKTDPDTWSEFLNVVESTVRKAVKRK